MERRVGPQHDQAHAGHADDPPGDPPAREGFAQDKNGEDGYHKGLGRARSER